MTKKIIIVIALVVLFILALFFFLKNEKEIVIEDIEELVIDEIDISDWGYYRNEALGIQFRYPGDDITQNQGVIDSDIGLVYLKTMALDINSDEVGYDEDDDYYYVDAGDYREIFKEKVNDSYLGECNSMDLPLPIFNISLKDSCIILNSDNGVKMVTGFYDNMHGDPSIVASFFTDDYLVLLILYYYNEDGVGGELSTDEFVNNVITGNYPNISTKINEFYNIIKTVELIGNN